MMPGCISCISRLQQPPWWLCAAGRFGCSHLHALSHAVCRAAAALLAASHRAPGRCHLVLLLPLSLTSILTFFPSRCAAFPQDRPSQDRILAVAAPNNSVAWMVYVQVSCYQPLTLQHFPFDRWVLFGRLLLWPA